MTRLRIPAPTPDGVHLFRDEHGVPHIVAPDLELAYWGMGYCHAFDRPLQMLIMRILGQGRASECLEASDQMLDVDLFFRRMNWAGNMETALQQLDDECRAGFSAYCDGVNARFAIKKRPWEMALVGYKPEPWRLEDSLLMSRMVGYLTLAQSQAEMERLLVEMVQAGIPDDKLEALFPGKLKGLDRDLLDKVKLCERIVPEALTWLSPAPRMMASNNWVISPAKSASGAAMMANDPHLEINRLPNVWVEQVVELPDSYWMGTNMPGLPAPLLGRNEHLAWGVTYTFADAVDSWIEHCRDGRYRRGDEWVPFRVREETIKRKKKPDVVATFYENDHGVLDGPSPGAPGPLPDEEGYYLATRWAPDDSGGASIAAARDMWSAATVEEGMAHLGRIESSWNWVLADDKGNIGYQMSGSIPIRHPDANGFVPMPGWLPEYDWRGMVDPGDLPRCINPEEGFIVTANQDLNALGKVDPINMPMGDHRARRIAELLAASDELGIEDFARIHLDDYSIQAAEFMDVLRPLLPDTATGRILAEWDCHYDVSSRGPVAFERFYRALRTELFTSTMGEDVLKHLLDDTGVFIDFYQDFDHLLLAEGSPWHGERSRDELFRAAVESLPEHTDPTWGRVNRVMLTNIFFGGKLPRFLGFDRGPIPLRGGRATPHQGQIYTSAGRATSFAPSLRMVADLSEQTLSTSMPGGPSDRRFSRWYNSGTADWLSGRYKTLTIDRQLSTVVSSDR